MARKEMLMPDSNLVDVLACMMRGLHGVEIGMGEERHEGDGEGGSMRRGDE